MYHFKTSTSFSLLCTCSIALVFGGWFFHAMATDYAADSPQSTNEINLVEATKPYKIYDLTMHIPASWKVESSFTQENDNQTKGGSLRALDLSRSLSYPRNIELRVISEQIYADHTSTQLLQKTIQRNFSASNRQIQNYQFNGSRYIKVAKTEDATLLFSTFRISDQEYGHIHLAIPRHNYYYLFTYTDLNALISQNTDESFEMFWNIISQLELPERSIFSDRSIELIIIFFAFLCALLCIWRLSLWHKTSNKQQYTLDATEDEEYPQSKQDIAYDNELPESDLLYLDDEDSKAG